ncbi:hypothetical protein KKH13_03330 [Patescibacteria group bacterium]|nr:hypothetical protein [Patescibacteria group bacterium]
MITKKKLFIVSGAFLGFVLILFLISLTSTNKSDQKPAQSQPSFQPFFIDTPQPEISFQDLAKPQEKTLAAYQLPPANQENLTSFFTPIIDDLKLKLDTSVETDYFTWNNENGYLMVNKNTGQFVLKIQPPTPRGGIDINETDALTVAKNWLVKYQLMDPETEYLVSYLEPGDELQPTPTKTPGNFYQFHFLPRLNNYPLFPGNYEPGPVSVIITNQGEVFYINYQLPPLFYAQYLKQPQSVTGKDYKLKTTVQIDTAINNNQAVIISSQLESGEWQTSTAKVKQVNYQKSVLGYSAEPQNNLIIPVLQLRGTALLDDGETTQITAYLPALAE